LVPVTQGLRYTEHFAIQTRPPGNPTIPLAIARLGPNSTAAKPHWEYRYTIDPGADRGPVAYLHDSNGQTVPEVILSQTSPQARDWRWVRTMLDAGRAEECFTLDAFRYRSVRNIVQDTFVDEDGTPVSPFALEPQISARSQTMAILTASITATASVGGRSTRGFHHPCGSCLGRIDLRASNPFASTGGADAETNEQVRRRARRPFNVKSTVKFARRITTPPRCV